jgi:hypothetical protein
MNPGKRNAGEEKTVPKATTANMDEEECSRPKGFLQLTNVYRYADVRMVI